MYKIERPYMFNSLEDCENFVSQLLDKETDLKVDPMLEWEDAMAVSYTHLTLPTLLLV